MDYLPLKTKHRCWVRFIYSCNIYDDILEGQPNIEYGVIGLTHLKDLAIHLTNPHIKTTIIGEKKVGEEILPYRGNIAHIYDVEYRGNVIWFDDNKLDAMQALSNIITNEGFLNLTEQYFL